MNEVAFFLSLIGSFGVLGIAYFILKGTVLDISCLRDNPWPVIWYLQLFFTLLPLVVVGYLGIENISMLYIAKPGLETPVAVAVIMTLLLYIFFLAFFLRVFGLYRRKVLCFTRSDFSDISKRIAKFCNFLSIIGLLLLVAFYILGYQHAFLFSLIYDVPLLQVRLHNAYATNVPSQVRSILFLIGYLLAILSGYYGRYKITGSLLYFLIALFILTSPGDKASFVFPFIFWLLAYGKPLPQSPFSRQALRFILFFVIAVLGLVYLVVNVQTGHNISIQEFCYYLLNRLGVGQMAGVYETAGLVKEGNSLVGDFYWHMIPFARFFVDYVDYQKYLMMITEGYGFSEMGVKNTYFLAEAYAIGGTYLAIFSPVIVAFSTSFGLLLLIAMFKFFFGNDLPSIAAPLSIALYLKTHDITGGFSSFPLLKGLLLIIFQLGGLWILWMLWKFCLSIRHKDVKTIAVLNNSRQYSR